MNILVNSSGNLLLADFELAIDYRNCQSTAGTPTYAAPEQKQGRPCPASDQYALGVLVYQWLCGELPFHGSSVEMETRQDPNLPSNGQISKRKSQSPPRTAHALSSAVENVVLTALAKDPNSRFTNIQTFAEVFGQACRSSVYQTPAVRWHSLLEAPTKI